MGDDTRVTVRLPEPLYEQLEETVEHVDATRSQVIREGIRRVVTDGESAGVPPGQDVSDVLDRLESLTADVERQATRLERLPLE